MTDYAEIEIERDFEPVTLPPDTTIMNAARHMRSRSVSAVLVTEAEGELVGIFTERDGIRRVLAEGLDPSITTLADVMTDNPETVSRQDGSAAAVRVMQAGQCRHVPIVEGSKAVGMVSRGRFSKSLLAV